MISILTTQFDFEIVNLHHKKLLIDNISYIHYAITLLGLSFFLLISNHISFIENMNLIKNLLKPKLPYCNIFFFLTVENIQHHIIYSYFEKGCRKKCTRQSRKVLWVVLSALFFKEIWKNGTGCLRCYVCDC